VTDVIEADTATALGLPAYDVAEEEQLFLPDNVNQVRERENFLRDLT
jgi:hypothetical protein